MKKGNKQEAGTLKIEYQDNCCPGKVIYRHVLVRERERGFTLVEVLVSLALLATIGVTFLTGLGTASTATQIIDARQVAKNLAESQIEHVKEQGFATSYTPAPIPNESSGYTATINVNPMEDGNIQEITVVIQHQSKPVIKLESYKTR